MNLPLKQVRQHSSQDIFTPELDEQLKAFLAHEPGPSRDSLRDNIVEHVMPYVKRIAHGLARRSTDPVEDLIQVGNIGLIKAVEKFNPLLGRHFKTYATYYITGEMRHYLRDKASMIKAPRQVYELYYRMNQIVEKLTEDLGRTPTDTEIADELACPVDHVNQAQQIERRRSPVSLDQFLVSDNGQETVYLEKLVDDRDLEQSNLKENRMMIENALDTLPQNLSNVVRMTFYEDMSQTQIADQLGISQMQVSRRLRKALDQLSTMLKPEMLE